MWLMVQIRQFSSDSGASQFRTIFLSVLIMLVLKRA
jgi:hypothetical protein